LTAISPLSFVVKLFITVVLPHAAAMQHPGLIKEISSLQINETFSLAPSQGIQTNGCDFYCTNTIGFQSITLCAVYDLTFPFYLILPRTNYL
jgi:hypothetical protein